MHVEKKRIFVGNLPPYIDENEIRKQFLKYGKVVTVDIKQRKVTVNENISPVFAFVNIEIDNTSLQKCFQEISNYNWQGYYATLELAKESFLDRLKREREEAQAKNSPNDLNSSKTKHHSSAAPTDNVKNANDEIKYKNISKQNGLLKKVSSSSSSDSDECDEKETNVKQNEHQKLQNVPKTKEVSSSDSDSNDDDSKTIQTEEKSTDFVENKDDDDGIKLVIKSNKHKTKDSALKIESVNSTPIHIITKKGPVKEIKDEKALKADERRRQSLMQMKNSYQQQKLSIKNALSKIDNKTPSDGAQNNKRRSTYDDTPSKKQKLSLFEDEADDENYNFEIKSQFEGKKGQKLLQLQSKFTNDKRFALNDRFAEDEDENYSNVEPDDERNQQLEILESVLGQKVRKDVKTDTQIPKGMLRYDPSKPEHSKFQIKRDEISKKNKKALLERKVERAPIPEVSKEKFYEVKENLKDALKEKEGFSLLSMFGRAEEKDEIEEEMPEEIQKSSKFDYNRNPFKYDSSDTEDEEPNKQKSKQRTNEDMQNKSSFKWSESFFFEPDDKRLKDGVDFLKNVSAKNSGSFKEKRRTLQRIISGKVRNVAYDKRKLERKLRKRIKVKRARKS